MNNYSAMGYVIMAMKNLGYKKEEMERLIEELYNVFDTKTESEAEELYNNPLKYEKNPNLYDNLTLEDIENEEE